MSDADTRALGRAAALLLVASLARVAWRPVGEGVVPAGPDAMPALLAETERRTADAERRARPLAEGERLDPNVAEAAELDRLPGVGPATAEAIVRSRERGGGFAVPEDLLRVRGVGPALLEKVLPHLALPGEARGTAGGPPGGAAPPRVGGRAAPTRRVDVNRADTLELQALPGVGPALARRIAEARSEAPFRAVDDLLRVRGIGPATLERLRPLVTVVP